MLGLGSGLDLVSKYSFFAGNAIDVCLRMTRTTLHRYL